MGSLHQNIVSYYNLQGNANDVTGKNTGATTFNVSYSTGSGRIGQGGAFTRASNSYIDMINSTLPIGNTPWTVACWVKGATAYSFNMFCWNLSFTAVANRTVGVYAITNTGQCTVGFLGATTINTGVNICDNNWHLIIVTYDTATTTTTCYVDNVNRGTYVATINRGDSNYRIGRLAVVNTDSWNGDLDEFAVWSRVLTSTERTQLWNQGAGLTYPFFNTGLLYNLL